MTTTTPPPPPQENPHESQETQEELILALRKELENLAKELHELAFRRAEGLLEKGAIPPASFLKNWTASSALPLNAFSSLFQHPKKWVNSVLKSDFLDLDTWRGVWYLLEAKREAQKLRKAGEYVTDEYGLDEEFFDKCRPFFTFLYKYYWRVETVGISNVPDEGGALLVCNHSGVLPWDGAMVNVAIWEEHPHPRHVRTLFLRWFKSLPFIAPILARTGAVLACPENAERLLKQKQLTAVFPEGLKGIGKLYKDRYHLARFGRGGFIKIAIHGQAPIIPVSIIGAEEIHPNLMHLNFLSKPLGLPYLPITPTFPLLGPLGLIPLPSKWMIKFSPPIPMEEYTPEDALDYLTVSHLTQQIRENIQDGIKELLLRRKRPFF